MKCPTCPDVEMSAAVRDVDYTALAGLRGKTVALDGITTFTCDRCKGLYLEIHRMADLHRELAATAMLDVKHLRMRFNGQWSALIQQAGKKTKS